MKNKLLFAAKILGKSLLGSALLVGFIQTVNSASDDISNASAAKRASKRSEELQ